MFGGGNFVMSGVKTMQDCNNIAPLFGYFLLYGKLAESETCCCANITEAVPGWLCLWHSIQFPGCESEVRQDTIMLQMCAILPLQPCHLAAISARHQIINCTEDVLNEHEGQ